MVPDKRLLKVTHRTIQHEETSKLLFLTKIARNTKVRSSGAFCQTSLIRLTFRESDREGAFECFSTDSPARSSLSVFPLDPDAFPAEHVAGNGSFCTDRNL